MDSIFRSAPEPQSSEPQVMEVGNESTGVGPSITPEPVSHESMPQTVLDVLGIDGDVRDLPSEEVENLQEISSYLADELKRVGKTPSIKTMGTKLDEIREELEMDEDTEAQVVLDRLGGVVKAWKKLGFMTNPSDKRVLFMKLARCKDSREMHKLVFREMDRYDW